MSRKTVLALGFDLPTIEGFETDSIAAERSLLDPDIIAVELTLQDFHIDGSFDGRPLLSKTSSFRYREFQQRWRTHIASALKAGKTVLFFLTSREEHLYYTGGKSVSGTGRNTNVTESVAPVSNYDLLPFSLTNVVYARGHSTVLTDAASMISGFWSRFSDRLHYNCMFEIPKATPLIKTKSGGHMVGAIVSPGLLLLPEINWDHLGEVFATDDNGFHIYNEDDELVPTEAGKAFSRKLRDSLIEIDAALHRTSDAQPSPAWSEAPEYRLVAESNLESQVLAIGSEIEKLELQRSERRGELEALGRIRFLLYGNGSHLESAVRQALSVIGFETHQFRQNDSEFDAIFESKEGRFLGEVEGKDNKAINVDKLSQLQRNLLEDFSRDDIDDIATGVLFGNPHRLTPPQERPDAFTAKVRTVAAAQRIALVQTTDLFRVTKYLMDTPDPAFAKKCREAIRSGVGGLIDFPLVPVASAEIVELEAASDGRGRLVEVTDILT